MLLQELLLQAAELGAPRTGWALYNRGRPVGDYKSCHPAGHTANALSFSDGPTGTAGEQEVWWDGICINRECHGDTVLAAGCFPPVCLSCCCTGAGLVL